jgi:hypothetical protein
MEETMGKASAQRELRRIKYLSGLAKENPEEFDKEWEKRVSSWLNLIQKDAGVSKRTVKTGGKATKVVIAPVFERVDIALEALRRCGRETYAKYAEATCEVLSTECCRQFGIKVDRNFYRLNNYRKPD